MDGRELAQTVAGPGHETYPGEVAMRDMDRMDSAIEQFSLSIEVLRKAIDPVLDPSLDQPHSMVGERIDRPQTPLANRIERIEDLTRTLNRITDHVRL